MKGVKRTKAMQKHSSSRHGSLSSKARVLRSNKDTNIIARFNEVIIGFCFVPSITENASAEDIREAAVKVLERMSHNAVIKLAAYFRERYAHWCRNCTDLSDTQKAKCFCFSVINKLASYSCDLGDAYYRDTKRVGRGVGNNVEIKEFYAKEKGGDELTFYFSKTL